MITISPGNVWSDVTYDLQDASPLKNILSMAMKVEVPGATYTFLFKTKQWDGKVQLWEDITQAKGHWVRIRTGLVPRLCLLLDLGNVSWRLGTDQRGLPSNPTLQRTRVRLRDYQIEAVHAAFLNEQRGFGWWPRGVQEIATGGGKTEVAVAMYEMNPTPTFFLVHRKDLLIQAKERFEKYGHTVGVIGGGEFKPNGQFNIATMQTLREIFNAPGSTRAGVLNALVAGSQQVFFDECHLMASSEKKGNEFIGVADKFEAPFRWGLTATPFMRAQYDNMLLEGVSGSSLYTITSKELIDRGHLTQPQIIMRHVPGTLHLPLSFQGPRTNKAKAKHWRKVETQGIKENEGRTKVILEDIEAGPYPMLVLVKTVDQATYIQNKYLQKTGKALAFLSGKDKAVTRREAVRQLIDGELDILLTTTIFDEGVDIPELAAVSLAGGGKSTVKTIQRAGRVLRTALGKKKAVIYDYQDEHHPMLKRHAKARMKVYQDQQFEVIVEEKR